MNLKVAKVMKGFSALSVTERSELIAEINKYVKLDASGRIALESALNVSVRKSLDAVNFGPAPGSCPCCGR